MKKYILGSVKRNAWDTDFGLLIVRGAAGLSLAIGHGFGKIPVSEKFIGIVDGMGFPLPFVFAWAAALTEAVGGILLALGLLTRPVAFLVLMVMTVAFFVTHSVDPFPVKEKALLYGIVAVLFILSGSGRFGIDNYLLKKKG